MLFSDPLANFKTFSERVSYIKTTTSVGLCLSRDFSASTDTPLDTFLGSLFILDYCNIKIFVLCILH